MSKVIPVSIIIPIQKVTSSSFELWLQLRKENGPLNGFLEFPGGKIEANEQPIEAALRELKEETGVELTKSDLKLFKLIPFKYPDRTVSLFIFITYANFTSPLGQWKSLKYLEPLKEIKDLVLPANQVIIDDLAQYLSQAL